MRRIGIAVAALVAAMLGVLGTATPAQAKPNIEGYVAISAYGDKFPGWFWVDELDGIIGCPKCLHWFDFGKSQVLNADEEAALNRGIVSGLSRLGEARVATRREDVARLRAEALEQFTAATRALGTASLRAGPVGFYDPDRDTTEVTGAPWLAAADQDIADGIGLLQRALADPDPHPWIARAVAELDQAYEEIATKQAINS